MADYHECFMQIALEESIKGLDSSEIPVGCVIVHNGNVVSTGHNKQRADSSRISHAEINTVFQCSNFLDDHKYLCDLYVTIEPCMMCMGAIINSRIRNVYYAVKDMGAGYTVQHSKTAHYQKYSPNIIGGILEKDCKSILEKYFEINNLEWGREYFGF